MATKTVYTRIQTKRDTAANWESKNPVLLNGEEIIVDTSAGEVRKKIGDGKKTYTQLPFTDETLKTSISNKVDKVTGKGLSANDFTNTLLTKLNGIADGANKYTHPSYTAKSAGLYKVTVDATGHVSATTAVTKADITGLGIPSTNTTYSNMCGATSSAAGNAGLVPAPAAGKQASFLRGDGTWVVPTNTTYSDATQSTHGLMSTADKTKLDGIAANANNYTHPATHAASMITQDATHRFVNDDQISTWEGKAEAKHTHTKSEITDFPTSLPANGGTATKANTWTTARNINGLSIDGSTNRVNYGTCTTVAATAEKKVACAGFALVTGASITVKFTVTNTTANPTLNVNETGAKAIYYRGSAISAGYLAANRTYTFRYNGTQYELVGDLDTNTTYADATTSAHGLMTAADKTKLNGIAANANNYTHPSSHPATMITEDTTHRFVTDTEKSTWNAKASTSVATTSANGLMSSTDKSKLDGIASGANKTVVDDALSSTSTNPVQNKVINTALAGKASRTHTHTAAAVGADPAGSANTALSTAKSYTDTKISDLINGAPETLDTLGEIATAMEDNKTVVDALQSAIGSKAAASDLASHTGNTTVHITSAERTKWNTAATHASSAHAPSNAQANQNAFSNIVVGSTTVAADSPTDTVTLAGSNVTLTPDATNDKVTIGITKDNVTAALGYTPPTTNTTYGVATTSANGLMSSTDKTKLDGIAANANNYTHPSSHAATMITQDATHRFVSDTEKSTWNAKAGTSVATTSANGLMSSTDKTTLNTIASKYAGSSSAGGAANSAVKLSTARKISLGTAATSTATAFDGSGDITIPVNSVKEAYLEWGGKNFAGAFGPIDAAMIPDLGANRLAFMPVEGVTIESSTDGGSTWVTYPNIGNDTKLGLFNGNGTALYIGGTSTAKIDKSKYMVRVTIDTSLANVYTALNKFCIYCSTNGSTGSYCTIQGRTRDNVVNNKDTWTTFANKIGLSGWSGYNIINTSAITTYGNSSSQYQNLRFTFGVTSHADTVQYAGLQISKILGFGGVGWNAPSTMARTGRMYTYDNYKNVAFPAAVTATSFNGNATSATKLGTSAGSATQPVYFSDGKPVATTYTLGKSVPSDAKFTDTVYTHPSTHAASIITQDATHRFVSDTEKSTWNAKASTSVATTSANGLMSSTDKSKLDGIASNANNYTHPSYTARSAGLYKITVDATGHVSAATAVTKADITGLGIPSTNTTYSNMTAATANAAGTSGLVPAPGAGKQASFLRGDGTWVVPTNTTYNNMNGATSSAAGTSGLVPAPAAGKQASFLRGDGTWVVPTNTTYSDATTSAHGLMTAADKTKLNGIATGANNYTHPSYTAKSSGLYKVTVDATGHVSATTAVTKADITGLGIPGSDTTYSAMTAATSSAAGKAGLVPAPGAGKQASFLRGDGTWAVPTNTTYSVATTSANGLMSSTDKTNLNSLLTRVTTLETNYNSLLAKVKTGLFFS